MTFKPCARCGEPHHHFSYCKDGVKRIKNAPPFRKGDPLRGAAKTAAERKRNSGVVATDTAPIEPVTTEAAAVAPAPATVAAQAREELRTLAASMPEGSQSRKAIEVMISRDEARDGHAQAEAELRRADPSAHLPLPTILRDPSEEKGRELNREMDRLLFAAGTTRASQREVLPKEAQTVHDTLTGLEERRDKAASTARDAAKPPEHRPGSQVWACTSCGQRFHTGTLTEVREWARRDPSWRLACPECHSAKVRVIEVA